MHTSNPYAPPQAAVHDVSMPYEQMEMADLATRFAAAILDGIILAVAVYLPFVLVIMAQEGLIGAGAEAAEIGALVVMFVGFVGWCWMTIVYVARNGQSIGKRLVNIKVVRSDGSKASLGRIFWLRNVVNGAIGIIPLYAVVDHLFVFGASRQCIHDKIADTIVVKT